MTDLRLELIPLTAIYWAENERKLFDPATLATLAESIKANGIKQPIGLVAEADGRYRGLWGQRRFKAAALAGLSTIPAMIHPAPKDEIAAAEIRLCENVAREALTPMELAAGLERILSGGGTANQVAARIGMSGPAVSRAVSLLKLSPAIQSEIQAGRISAAAGYELAQIQDIALRDELARQAAEGKISRDELAVRRKSATSPANPAATAHAGQTTPTRATAKLGNGKSVTVYAPGLDLDGMIQTLELALSHARQARSKRLQLGTFLRMLRDTVQD